RSTLPRCSPLPWVFKEESGHELLQISRLLWGVVFSPAFEFSGFAGERGLHVALEIKQESNVFFDTPDAVNGALEGRFCFQGDRNPQNYLLNAGQFVQQMRRVITPQIKWFSGLGQPGPALHLNGTGADFFPFGFFLRRAQIGILAFLASFIVHLPALQVELRLERRLRVFSTEAATKAEPDRDFNPSLRRVYNINLHLSSGYLNIV